MKTLMLLAAATLSLGLSACGGSDEAAEGEVTATTAEMPVEDASADMGMGDMAAPADAGAVHTATGEVTAVSGDEVTIAHGPVPSLGWPDMTMAFRAEELSLAEQVKTGDRVTFTFRQDGGEYVLTSIQPQQ